MQLRNWLEQLSKSVSEHKPGRNFRTALFWSISICFWFSLFVFLYYSWGPKWRWEPNKKWFPNLVLFLPELLFLSISSNNTPVHLAEWTGVSLFPYILNLSEQSNFFLCGRKVISSFFLTLRHNLLACSYPDMLFKSWFMFFTNTSTYYSREHYYH